MAWSLGSSHLVVGQHGVSVDISGAVATASLMGHDPSVMVDLLSAVQSGIFSGQAKKRQRENG